MTSGGCFETAKKPPTPSEEAAYDNLLYQIARLFSDGDAAQYRRYQIPPPKRTFRKLSRRMMVNDIRRDHQPANQGRRFHKVGVLHPVKRSRAEIHQEQDFWMREASVRVRNDSDFTCRENRPPEMIIRSDVMP